MAPWMADVCVLVRDCVMVREMSSVSVRRHGATGGAVANKRERRSELRARRREIAARRDLAADGERLAERALTVIEEYARAGGDLTAEQGITITAYEPLPVEPDVSALVRRAYDLGVRVLMPITLPGFDLDWPVVAETSSPAARSWTPSPRSTSPSSGSRWTSRGPGWGRAALPRPVPAAPAPGTPVICIPAPRRGPDPAVSPRTARHRSMPSSRPPDCAGSPERAAAPSTCGGCRFLRRSTFSPDLAGNCGRTIPQVANL